MDTDPTFIQALGDLVAQAMINPPITFGETIRPAEDTKFYPQERWEWGLTTSAEVWNGRLAMLGILGLIAELLVGQGPLHSIGFL